MCGATEKCCIVFVADSDQYREDEYQDIVREINDYNEVAESKQQTTIKWEVYCGREELNDLHDKDVIVVFTSDNMVRCLDHGHNQDLRINAGKNRTEHFELIGEDLRRYLTRDENFRKVFVVESEDCEKIGFLGDIPEERTFDASDIDVEEFIGKIIS